MFESGYEMIKDGLACMVGFTLVALTSVLIVFFSIFYALFGVLTVAVSPFNAFYEHWIK